MTSNGIQGDNIAPPRRDYRHHCNRLLFRGSLPSGTYIEIRCPKCGRMHVLNANTTSVYSNGHLTAEAQLL
jgi:phage FluMu protein Com